MSSKNSKAVALWFLDLSHCVFPTILSKANHVPHTATGRAWCFAGGEVLELITGVTTSRRAKLPMALFTINGGGVGAAILVWECRSAGFGLGNIAWRDMCELRGDSLGNGRVIWPSLWGKKTMLANPQPDFTIPTSFPGMFPWLGGPQARETSLGTRLFTMRKKILNLGLL